MSCSKLLPLLSLLSLLIATSACDLAAENTEPAADGSPGYANRGWVDADPMFITHACAPASIKTDEAYGLRVKFQAPCWGIALNSTCVATLKGKTIELNVSYQAPNWTQDGGYCEKEVTCMLPALPKGDYVLGPGSSCSPAAITLQVRDQTSGAPTCSATAC